MEASQGAPVVVESHEVTPAAAPVAEAPAVEATEAAAETAAPGAPANVVTVEESDRAFAIRNLRRIAENEHFDGGVQTRACELILMLGAGSPASASALVR